ncbi:unnamed protein product [Protopolystoma xenopodis]|uniref:Uncharacterized protein n=1 Tax=Protopolystoma xenopodis TaxID=117903 RepID=A0A448WW98_9PLAT|nr:unnamed protein product [Protopolystoma xenopodis]
MTRGTTGAARGAGEPPESYPMRVRRPKCQPSERARGGQRRGTDNCPGLGIMYQSRRVRRIGSLWKPGQSTRRATPVCGREDRPSTRLHSKAA